MCKEHIGSRRTKVLLHVHVWHPGPSKTLWEREEGDTGALGGGGSCSVRGRDSAGGRIEREELAQAGGKGKVSV